MITLTRWPGKCSGPNNYQSGLQVEGTAKEVAAYFSAMGCLVQLPRTYSTMRDAHEMEAVRGAELVSRYLVGRGGARAQHKNHAHDPGDEDQGEPVYRDVEIIGRRIA